MVKHSLLGFDRPWLSTSKNGAVFTIGECFGSIKVIQLLLSQDRTGDYMEALLITTYNTHDYLEYNMGFKKPQDMIFQYRCSYSIRRYVIIT